MLNLLFQFIQGCTHAANGYYGDKLRKAHITGTKKEKYSVEFAWGVIGSIIFIAVLVFLLSVLWPIILALGIFYLIGKIKKNGI